MKYITSEEWLSFWTSLILFGFSHQKVSKSSLLSSSDVNARSQSGGPVGRSYPLSPDVKTAKPVCWTLRYKKTKTMCKFQSNPRVVSPPDVKQKLAALTLWKWKVAMGGSCFLSG